MAAMLEQQAERWEMAIPQPQGEVVAAMQQWAMESHVVQAGEITIQAWTATKKELSETYDDLTLFCEAPACRSVECEQVEAKNAPLIVQCAPLKAVLPAHKLPDPRHEQVSCMFRLVQVLVGVACVLAGLEGALLMAYKTDRHAVLENRALPVASGR